MDKPAPTAQPIHPLLAGRWSPRVFDRAQTLDTVTWQGLLEAAIWAPSCSNEQPWRFAVGVRGDDEALAARWQAIYDGLAGGNQRWCVDAAALVVTLATRTFAAHGAANPWAWHDTGMAGLSMALEAHNRGLGAHAMAGWDGDALRANLSIADDLDIVAVWAIGFPDTLVGLDDRTVEREKAPRQRKPVADVLV